MWSPVDGFLRWWLRSGRYGWSRLHRRIFEGRYLSVNLPTANSLEDIGTCLSQITWTMDGPLHLFDCVSYPQVTWLKKKDDCDGFSSLAAALLSGWDANSRPVLVTALVRPVRQSHTVCAFSSPDGALSYFDNSVLHSGDCASVEEIVASISHGSQRLVCWDVRDPLTFELLEFHILT